MFYLFSSEICDLFLTVDTDKKLVMASFGVVDQAVKSTHTVEEYIKVGMDIVKEVALDFVEHNQGMLSETCAENCQSSR